jgi:hypothetical protein
VAEGRLATPALRRRKALLVRSFAPPPHLLHASLLERFPPRGKPNGRCHRKEGPKQGPFSHLNRCFPKGQLQTLRLKSQEQIDPAPLSLAAPAQIQESVDEISQIQDEWLRRGQDLPARPGTGWRRLCTLSRRSSA